MFNCLPARLEKPGCEAIRARGFIRMHAGKGFFYFFFGDRGCKGVISGLSLERGDQVEGKRRRK